ncbi:RING finger domain protein (Rnf10), putative [Talaromyces stipitatus ATCC 10500]|uniref:RING finger domain protein (Rnf10), putative n=1 Tax=Talaromyces stipitatus (strain ATCC 10500 / CBS 375.48 / QM 6759 / NRRL 1006) TaxID=441959 RepID=B8ML93_TALSN|nr:RING finger domain protein (Rnf10), putative [Talaromyces stipitatus ATCC 10500]EED15008.1 RING finger domain protein (Rnf10), putative [Talaromyces stipitatus ATCC 10500]
MSSSAGQTIRNFSKSTEYSSSISTSSASFQGTASSVESGPQRRSGGNNSFGAGSITRNTSAARNNQPRKGQHRKHHRPNLVNEDAYAESAIMRSTTSRKGQTSITHLMNFSLPPRPQYHPSSHRPRRNPTWGMGSGYHAIDKARYVHANYRFIVNPRRNYHAQAANADVHLDWDSVLQVLASEQTQAASCPICLGMPVAPRMAKCGHIFCYPCLIRYMHSTDDDASLPEKKARWKKCPICWDTIYVSDTRPVRWFVEQQTNTPVEGGDVVLRLVKRNPGRTLALPRDGAEELNPQDDIPWYHAAEVADYARIMKGGEDYMVSQYDDEIELLIQQRQEDELLFGDDSTWVQKAINSINEAREKVRGLGNPPPIARAEKKRAYDLPLEDLVQQPNPDNSNSTVSNVTTSATSDIVDEVAAGVDVVNLNGNDHPESRKKDKKSVTQAKAPANRDNTGTNTEQPYYFYQCLPHFYLSALDIRILKAAFGDYSSFPATILPRVEHISTGHIVDDELRKRAKYLGHLPYGCEVSFLECDWTDVVVPEVLERFRLEINKRRQRNRDKEAREEKDRIRAEKEEEEKRWEAARRKRPSFGFSASERPFSDQDFLPLNSESAATLDSTEFAGANSPPNNSHMITSRFEALASPSTSPPVARTVWGTAAVQSDPDEQQQPLHRTGPINDGWLQGWEEDLLGQQEAELLAQTAAESSSTSANPGGGGGRKKKNKKITLMSTNIQRGA